MPYSFARFCLGLRGGKIGFLPPKLIFFTLFCGSSNAGQLSELNALDVGGVGLVGCVIMSAGDFMQAYTQHERCTAETNNQTLPQTSRTLRCAKGIGQPQ